MQHEKPGHIRLSPEDIELLRLLVAGKRNEEIGAALGINSKSVEQQVTMVVKTVRKGLDRY
jgi:DNA-binding CsgD family transcriptional regulator